MGRLEVKELGLVSIISLLDTSDRAVANATVSPWPNETSPVRASASSRTWRLDLDIDPLDNTESQNLGYELLTKALGVIGHQGGGVVQWWVNDPTESDEALGAMVGLKVVRELCQLRRPLPLDEPPDAQLLSLRSFRIGHDEDSWLALNNRAFHWHPEQGGWTHSMLVEREHESWFNPEGFLLYERDGRLGGFCWTKIHAEADPPLGEIYVIGVDPELQGLGLGRSLVIAGLEWLTRQGLGFAMLWVEATNGVALNLYESLGFTVHQIQRVYQVEVPQTP